ncbi:zinc finger CCHC-type and RNA-binding motif-containing protein 1-like [Artemia franciscana]|uniref:Zinc finger CCHC-type and RNA-binding motif-containing protein 1 n=1 Tax=Artemia franciscana TaxID=6661 RepID=A0AA88LFE4_ARTSF|nr:hypothetical protein QYM36_001254 [Artemia franciscana]KAK2724693.1 hypothetical protein QYM36_001254 [Artemia franciscana]KAK2724694.1 hypothetical protein QYM36_001254 [Artemia franciscana]
MNRPVLAPSKSTVHISSLPFSLTNCDIYQLCQNYGKIVRVTILRDEKRRSKGVAFVLFLTRDEAFNCVKELNNKELFGRTLKASLARDNGRAAEFIRRREYPDKSKCYECGELGHLSYKCPKNLLGDRELPPKKRRIKAKSKKQEEEFTDESDGDIVEDPNFESLSTAIRLEQESISALECRSSEPACNLNKRLKFKKSSYFSDEEEAAEGDE